MIVLPSPQLSFVRTSPPNGLLYEMELTSLLKNAGPPCRGCLEIYFKSDRKEIHVESPERIIAVPIDNIISKAMKIDIDRAHSYTA